MFLTLDQKKIKGKHFFRTVINPATNQDSCVIMNYKCINVLFS